VALTAYVPHNYPLDKLEPGLNETAFYDPTNFTFPAGTYICEVEVDPADRRGEASTASPRWTTSAPSSTR
jgi:CO/xanthine dehydrogenase Mo-binding subunit